MENMSANENRWEEMLVYHNPHQHEEKGKIQYPTAILLVVLSDFNKKIRKRKEKEAVPTATSKPRHCNIQKLLFKFFIFQPFLSIISTTLCIPVHEVSLR